MKREKTTLFEGYLNRGQAQSELNLKSIGQGVSGLVCLQETIRHGKEHEKRAAGEFVLPTIGQRRGLEWVFVSVNFIGM